MIIVENLCSSFGYRLFSSGLEYCTNMIKLGIFAAIVLLISKICDANVLTDTTGKVILRHESSNNGLKIELVRDDRTQLSGNIGKGIDFEKLYCSTPSDCTLGDHGHFSITPLKDGFNISFWSNNTDISFEDCIYLNSSNTHWYGGPQRAYQVWPLEKMNISGDDPYAIRRADNFAVAERYWLNSNGAYIFVDQIVPLWIDQNNKYEDQVCLISYAKSPYINRWRVVQSYLVMSGNNAKEAHLQAVNLYLGKPTKHPNEKMVREPIWTTWAKFKRDINDSTVLEFAKEIRSHGYQGGQLEIDDKWEPCYGAEEFDSSKFKAINNTIRELHDDDWRVSLWIHPFIDENCPSVVNVGKEKGYFVRNETNQTLATWWNSNNSHQIDYTNPEAAEWWTARLKKLRESPGIDSFKFDAGETDYMNAAPVYKDVENSPNILNQKYIEACVQFGDLIEVRSSFRAQQYGEFIRMIDKDSNWSLQNGLATLITTLLQLNLNGYAMVLPDMIGGNGYGELPTGELLVRWTQANTFMPAMQFSYLPWDYKNQVDYDIEGIVKKYVDLHQQYASSIVKAMEKNVQDGSPVNGPVWWVDPTDSTALGISDEYLLGEEILVAPVIFENSVSRDVYLPRGRWKDGNNGTIFRGPTTLRNYPAPIDVLPYFIKQ